MGRVLVVDDHEDTVLLFCEELRAEGFDVDGTTSANDALSLAITNAPEVIVMDIAMPDIDGYELARLVRSYAPTRSVRLIAVSAHAFDLTARQTPPGGWDARMSKPCEPGSLATTVRAVLGAGPERRKSGPVPIVVGPSPSGSKNGTGEN